ncbi:hypothetical protein BDB01DRAFT_816934 [Pilobolus umbonatus]|nr:hypothetical protein BDB01DRAFT_816934 [Pilobolus umbonatus]
MSAKAFTPWWRLLYNSIGHRTKLHRWSSTHFDTPVCGICSRENESLYHFSVGCIRKSNFWMDVYTALDKPEFLSSEMAVWTALTSLSQLDNSHCSPEDLAILGCAFSSLWKYHWRSVIDHIAWSRPAAINMFKNEHQIHIQKYLEANVTSA